MGIYRTDGITATDFSSQSFTTTSSYNSQDAYSVDSKGLDDENDDGYIPNFDKWNGYYKTIPEYKTIIDTLVKWAMGKGYKGEAEKLKRIIGNGKENALKVLKNVLKCALICGDGFAEIIKDKQGRLTNLKPLNPQKIKVITNKYGMITQYKQINKNSSITWASEDIFHISNDRIGDECHGIALGESIEKLILARNEVLTDLKIMFHRFVKPIRIWEADTDDTTKLSTIGNQINEAYKLTENLVVPKQTLELKETNAVPTQTGGLSPLEYYNQLVRVFISSCGVPEVILGWGKDTTEASSKVVYLAWEQTIEEIQRKIEDDIETQLNIKIELEFPASIEENIRKDEQKDTPINKERKSEITPKINKLENNN